MSRAGPSNTVPSPVVISLYRTLLKEAKVLDNVPILKVLMPVPPKFQPILGMSSPLYVPGGASYVQRVRDAFRNSTKVDLSLGFEGLGRLRMHNDTVGRLLPRITQDHAALIAALSAKGDVASIHQAKLAKLEGLQPNLLTPSSVFKKNKKGKLIKFTPEPLKVTQKLTPGLGLIAHPLSSSHVDRRVMMVVESDAEVTTAIVLDMLYAYPLSHGNPMFPEVFWGHEVHSGGYCHVDFTMPPTASVAVLHTLEPPRDETSTEYKAWKRWIKASEAKDSPTQHHELLCKPIIKGSTQADGTVIPTLYYSKAEALPFLATLCPGKLRSSVRVYWGVMKWTTSQIEREIEKGHWIPVELSANFFGAYPFVPSTDRLGERFPTKENLKAIKDQRIRTVGADVTIPQTFPPIQPLCGRESLWDQILFSMGGEFRSLVGTINPFSNPKSDFARLPEPGLLAESGEPDTPSPP